MITGGLTEMKKNKIARVWFFYLAFFIFLLPAASALSKQIVIDSEKQFEFAESLMKKDKCDQAIGEFEKLIHFFPNDVRIPKAEYFIGVCHFKNRNYEKARDVFTSITTADTPHPFSNKAMFLTGESYYQQGITSEAAYYFGEVARRPFQDETTNEAIYRLGWTMLKTSRWKDAETVFKEVEEESPLYYSAQELAEKSLGGESLPYKSPVRAGVLGAIIPGLGHAYVSRYKDATIAFLLNGLFIWAAVEAFNEDLNVLGGILTLLELGWYTGNIYSAVNVTHKHNRKLQDDFRNSLKDRLDLKPFMTQNKQIGITLSFRFN
jgi:outer membrane protein assembly factor BamD (BamD/ComL family)